MSGDRSSSLVWGSVWLMPLRVPRRTRHADVSRVCLRHAGAVRSFAPRLRRAGARQIPTAFPAHPASRAVYLNGGMSIGLAGFTKTIRYMTIGAPSGAPQCKEVIMGLKAEEALDFDFERFLAYLRSKTRVFMDVEDNHYYVTHTDGYWRVQDCDKLNDKGRFSDCSELVTTMPEVVELPWRDGKSIHDLFPEATFYESVQEGWQQ